MNTLKKCMMLMVILVCGSADAVRIQQYGDTAIVAFRLVATRAKPPQTMNYFNTGTFLKRDALWQVVAWQATRIPDAV